MAERLSSQYYDFIVQRIKEIDETQQENIGRAAELLVNQIRKDGLIYVFGVGGHSYVGSEEFFYRAGGLANVSPMFELSLSLAGGGQKSTMLERLEGYGDKIVRAHHLSADDVLVISSVYGMNAATVDAALEAKKRNLPLIAITSIEAAEHTPSDFRARHSSGKNLHEIADVTIDTRVPFGEVSVTLPERSQKVGGTCNVLQCFCINSLVIATVERCLQEGIEPPIWHSANVAGGDEANLALLDKYTPRVKYL